MPKKIILYLLGIISIILFWIAPSEYSTRYVNYCTTVFIISSVVMLTSNCKQTFIKFEFFFLIAFFFTNFVYPLVFYPINPYFSLFRNAFNENYITKGTALASVAGTWYNIGIFENKPVVLRNRLNFNIQKHLKIPRVVAIVLFILFLPSLYAIYLQDTYTTEFESSFVNAVLRYILLYSIFAYVYNNRFTKLKTFTYHAISSPIIVLTLVYIIIFLLIGSRTIPLNVVLFSLFLFNVLIYRFSKKQIVILIVGGATLLTAVGIARGGSGVESGEISSVWDIGADLVINNRSLYVLMEETDKHGITFGETMLMNVLSAVPFAQSFYLNISGRPLSSISTAVLVTDLHFGRGYNPDRIGLGTNIVGDVYLAFGFIGVIILFWIFGYILRILYKKISKGQTIPLLIYALFFMNTIFFTRSGYCTPVRDVVWVLVVFWLSNLKIKKYE